MISEYAAREKLRKHANMIAKDIKGDFPEADVDYDLYVGKTNGMIRGVINMGDSYQQAYFWDNKAKCWLIDNSWPYIPDLIKELSNS